MKRELPQQYQYFLANNLRFEIDVNEFIKLVAEDQKLSQAELVSKVQKRPYINARSAIYYLVHTFGLIQGRIPTLGKIGSYFIGKTGKQKDHATILHHLNSHHDLMDSNDAVYVNVFMDIAIVFMCYVDNNTIDFSVKLDMCRKVFSNEQKDLILFLAQNYQINNLVKKYLHERDEEVLTSAKNSELLMTE